MRPRNDVKLRTPAHILKYKLLNPNAKPPVKKHDTDSGFDLCSSEKKVIKPGSIELIKLGVACDIPQGYMLMLCARSSFPLKTGLMVANGFGVIDQDYKGELMLQVINTRSEDVTVECGDRIAQIVPVKVGFPDLIGVDSLQDSERSTGGFGSTDEKTEVKGVSQCII